MELRGAPLQVLSLSLYVVRNAAIVLACPIPNIVCARQVFFRSIYMIPHMLKLLSKYKSGQFTPQVDDYVSD